VPTVQSPSNLLKNTLLLDVFLASDSIDHSGIKFHYTRKLRPYDAGVMELGLEYTDKYALPPGLPLWKLEGYCIPDCTRVVSISILGLGYCVTAVGLCQKHRLLCSPTRQRALAKHNDVGLLMSIIGRPSILRFIS